MRKITLKTKHGYSIVVPASLDSLTTYVLLEQERWFEDELDFLQQYLKPGMTAIDIGANMGAYTLLMSRQVGSSGRVIAYEPGSDARAMLEQSLEINDQANTVVSSAALSSRPDCLWLAHGGSSELNSLQFSAKDGERGEWVDVTTLDLEAKRLGLGSLDFIKIDAEGQEARIAVGGRGLLSKTSPLIMYEIVVNNTANLDLRWVFEVLGYSTYRLSGNSGYLVKVDDDAVSIGFELNFFAARPDLAGSMAEAGLLVDEVPVFELSPTEYEEAKLALLSQPFAQTSEFCADDFAERSAYNNALLAYAAYRYLGWACARRHAALLFAYSALSELLASGVQTNHAMLCTFARVADSLHYRVEALEAVKKLNAEIVNGRAVLDAPFFPASMRFEQIPAHEGNVSMWMAASLEDFWMRRCVYSSKLIKGGVSGLQLGLQRLAEGPYADADVRRRFCLVNVANSGFQPDMEDTGEGHLNAEYWKKSRGSIGLGLRELTNTASE